MLGLLKRFLSSNRGQAFPIVLAVLALGGLTIAASVSYATTNLKGSRIVQEQVKLANAAGAGVEYALWYLKKYLTAPTSPTALTENINQMAVNIQTYTYTKSYTLYLGALTEAKSGPHQEWFDTSTNITWDALKGAWKYTINVSYVTGTKKIKIDSLGARIPPGYRYRADLPVTASNDSTGTMDTGYPKLDGGGTAYLVNWVGFPSGDDDCAYVSQAEPLRTQSFYISFESGSGSLEGDYGWAVAKSQDVGTIGEIIGKRYKITSTATRPDGKATASIVADVIQEADGTIDILSWQIK